MSNREEKEKFDIHFSSFERRKRNQKNKSCGPRREIEISFFLFFESKKRKRIFVRCLSRDQQHLSLSCEHLLNKSSLFQFCFSQSENQFEGFASCKKIDISQLWVNDDKHEIYINQTSMSTFSQGYSKKFSAKLTFFMKILSLSKEVKEKLWVKSHTSRGEREIFL